MSDELSTLETAALVFAIVVGIALIGVWACWSDRQKMLRVEREAEAELEGTGWQLVPGGYQAGRAKGPLGRAILAMGIGRQRPCFTRDDTPEPSQLYGDNHRFRIHAVLGLGLPVPASVRLRRGFEYSTDMQLEDDGWEYLGLKMEPRAISLFGRGKGSLYRATAERVYSCDIPEILASVRFLRGNLIISTTGNSHTPADYLMAWQSISEFVERLRAEFPESGAESPSK